MKLERRKVMLKLYDLKFLAKGTTFWVKTFPILSPVYWTAVGSCGTSHDTLLDAWMKWTASRAEEQNRVLKFLGCRLRTDVHFASCVVCPSLSFPLHRLGRNLLATCEYASAHLDAASCGTLLTQILVAPCDDPMPAVRTYCPPSGDPQPPVRTHWPPPLQGLVAPCGDSTDTLVVELQVGRALLLSAGPFLFQQLLQVPGLSGLDQHSII